MAAVLSFVLPGLGQLRRGEVAQGLAILSTTLGVLGGLALAFWGPAGFRSGLTALLLGLTYPFLWIPAVQDAWRSSDEAPSRLLSGESGGYVLFLLFLVGPMALPILWRSPVFPRVAKVLLTVLVIVVMLLAIATVVYLGPRLERLIPVLLEQLEGH